MKILKANILYLIFITAMALVMSTGNSNNAFASMGPCGDAEEIGVCLGDGAKCNIKKGFLTFRCGKDPNGPSIILE